MPTDFKIPLFLLANINKSLEEELAWLVVNVSYQMIDKEDVRFSKRKRLHNNIINQKLAWEKNSRY